MRTASSYSNTSTVCPHNPGSIEPEVVEPNLSLLPHPAGLLAEAEDPSEAGRCNPAAPGVAQDDFWRQIIDPAVGIRVLVRPMAPELVIAHELGMLPVDRFTVGAPSYIVAGAKFATAEIFGS
jgi:hypothetical protein